MNTIYFVRHAKPDFSVHDDLTRPLTEEGINASKRVTEFFKDKDITKMYSSPYKRSIDTIKDLSLNLNLSIELINDFRERKISDGWIEDFNSFSEMQWKDFKYKLEHGESLSEVQDRNINALNRLLAENSKENIIIGTHGTALSTIINYYDNNFGYTSFCNVKDVMPWVVAIEFDGLNLTNINHYLDI